MALIDPVVQILLDSGARLLCRRGKDMSVWHVNFCSLLKLTYIRPLFFTMMVKAGHVWQLSWSQY